MFKLKVYNIYVRHAVYVSGHQRISIQYPSHTEKVKIILQAITIDSELKPLSGLVQDRRNKNKTAIFKTEISSLHENIVQKYEYTKSCKIQVACIHTYSIYEEIQ